jgi:hypothetical protein
VLLAYRSPPGPGWHPITALARLAARLLEADLVTLPAGREPSRLAKLAALLARRRRQEPCLLLCPGPEDLDALLLVDGWRRLGPVVAWVIDSFWTERIPGLARHGRTVDQYFITGEEDATTWQRAVGRPVAWLPWGADALHLGTSNADRPLDLLRTGRQPPEWDDDAVTGEACRSLGLRFHGRPDFRDDADESQRWLFRHYGQARYSLAFSNLASPAGYTHPTRDYLSARWTDALAAGATVAGIAPASPSVQGLLWPGATLELGGVRRADGLTLIAEAVRAWRPEQAARNARLALQRLDWRWRLEVLARALGVAPAPLAAELAELRAVEPPPPPPLAVSAATRPPGPASAPAAAR